MIVRKIVGKIFDRPTAEEKEKKEKEKQDKGKGKQPATQQTNTTSTTTTTTTSPQQEQQGEQEHHKQYEQQLPPATEAEIVKHLNHIIPVNHIANRFRTHLQTDKNIYKPSETVYLRGFILNAFDHSSYVEVSNTFLKPIIDIISPKGDKVLTETLATAQHSVIWFNWEIPEEQSGGDYTIEISYPANEGFAFAQRTFNIRNFRPPRLKTDLEFLKKGYGAGEKAQAKLSVERAEGGYPVGATVEAVARIDGSEAFRGKFTVDENGKCLVSFDLPKQIQTGVGTLSCVIEDGGVVETASKTIPILLQSIDVDVYPEGGDLVAGLVSGLYIAAFTPTGDPADITAEIVSKKGVAGTINTDHEGRGKTTFTPVAGEDYHLKVIRPTGIVNTIPLPALKKSGVSLISTKKVYHHEDPIVLHLSSTTNQSVKVELFKLDALLDSKEVNLKKLTNETVTFKDKPQFHGVLRVTVSTSEGPVAERLIFRAPSETLKVEITPNKKNYTPGSSVSLKVKTLVNGKPTRARVGVTVTDDSVRKLTEKRQRPPRLMPMVLLEDEVESLRDAHVYFKSTEKKHLIEKGENAIDLLLGTQGWRRFIYLRKDEEIQKDNKKMEKVFAVHKATEPAPQNWNRNRHRFLEVEEEQEEWKQIDDDEEEPRMLIKSESSPRDFEQHAILDVPIVKSVQAAPPPPVALAPPPPAALAPPPPPAALAPPPPAAAAPAPPPAIDAPLAGLAFEAAPVAESRIVPMMEREMASMIMPIEHFEAEEEMAADFFFGDDEVVPSKNYTRVYAHAAPPKIDPTERVDFTETLYWQASHETDINGEFTVNFDLNDSVTSFIVMVDGIAGNVVGQGEFIFDSRQPFYVEPKLPLEVTSGDVIELPIAFVNNTDQDLSVDRNLSIKQSTIVVREANSTIQIGPDGRKRQLTTLDVQDGKGNAQVSIIARSSSHVDKVARTTKVVPRGFPFSMAASGLLKANVTLDHNFSLPAGTIMSSITTTGLIFPSPMSNLTEALKSLIQEPCGCFEQTSSTTYPLAMALKYFQTHSDVDPDLIKRSDEILRKGYKRLVGFECKDGGYDWFGSSPASEPLTSYGILEFTEFSKVLSGVVDPKMLQRCYDWLLSRRDGKGSFKINERVLHVWSTESLMSDAYILYSLTKAGIEHKLIAAEVDHLKARLKDSEDPYLLALLASVLYFVKDTEGYVAVLPKLAKKQGSDGSVNGAKTSVTHSGGKSLTIETTALCMLAWLSTDIPEYFTNAALGAKYLFSNCDLGGYGNTQSTVLTLEAIIAYDIKAAVPKVDSVIKFIVDGEVLETYKLTKQSNGAIELPDFSEAISLAGDHKVSIQQEGGGDLNYTLSVAYNADLPDSSPSCSVDFTHCKIRNDTIAEGEGTEIEVKIKNKKDEPLPMTMAIIGLPGGVDLRHEKMKELVNSGVVASYELLGARRVACYFRHLLPKQEISFVIDVVAAVPGQYTGPASCAYLYYTNEYKHWLEGLKVKIAPRS